MSSIVILGGAGFLGSNLARRHVEMGDKVAVVDNLITGREVNLAGLDISFVQHDVSHSYWISSISGISPPSVVYHLASPASPPAYQRYPVETMWANARGTENAIALCRATGARLVFASTSEVYGDPTVSPQPEDYKGNVSCDGPRSMYDEAKRFSEALINAYRSKVDLDAGVVRIFNTYGPGMDPDDGRVIPNFINQALAGELLTIYGSGDQTRSLCYVDDMVEALIAMGRSGAQGPINLGNPEEVSMVDLAYLVLRAVADVTGSPSESGISYLEAAPDDPQVRRPKIEQARAALGWEPTTPLAKGLLSTVEYFIRQA